MPLFFLKIIFVSSVANRQGCNSVKKMGGRYIQGNLVKYMYVSTLTYVYIFTHM